MNIILDLDGTLISELTDNCNNIGPRPYLKQFLHFCFQTFRTVSIWTAADWLWYDYIYRKYLRPILVEIDRDFDLVICGRCRTIDDPDPDDPFPTPIEIKPLRKIWKRKKGYTRHNTIIVDDTPHTYCWNYGNAVPIRTYEGNDTDNSLLKLCDLFLRIQDHFKVNKTVRNIEKRSY